jgi:hypothetical protein
MLGLAVPTIVFMEHIKYVIGNKTMHAAIIATVFNAVDK